MVKLYHKSECNMKNELILALDARCIKCKPSSTDVYPSMLSDHDIVIAERERLDKDDYFSRYKQLIGYVTIKDNVGRYLLYRRVNGSGETRLIGNESIGFGGHTDLADAVIREDSTVDLYETLKVSALRELSEEIGMPLEIASNVEIDPYNRIIVDTSNEVGKLHLGVLMEVVAGGDFTSTEEGIEILGWHTKEELKGRLDNMEAWSRAIIEQD